MVISRFLIGLLILQPALSFSQIPVKPPIPKINTIAYKDPFLSTSPKTNLQSIFTVKQVSSSIQQRNAQTIQQDIKEFETKQSKQARRNSVLEDAYASFAGSSPSIQYELTTPDPDRSKEYFYRALSEFQKMLEGEKPLSVKRAVFLTENAYDPSIKWEDFNGEIENMVRHVGFKMQQDKIEPSDKVGKNMALFQFFTDTLEVQYSGFEKPVVSYPLLYDFEDFWGQQDIRNVYVSKLMTTGTGQCHSLPLLYLILSKEIGAGATMAFSPNHSYIKFQDEYDTWHNVELTNGMFTSDQFILYSGYVNAIALQNEMYTIPLSDQEVIAQSVNDLAMSYIAKYGYDDFVLACTSLSLKFSRKSMTPHQLYNNYYKAKLDHVLAQYQYYGLTKKEFESDSTAQYVIGQIKGVQKHLEKLGFADMPAEQYQDWLNTVQEEGRKQEHRIKMRQIMSQIGNR